MSSQSQPRTRSQALQQRAERFFPGASTRPSSLSCRRWRAAFHRVRRRSLPHRRRRQPLHRLLRLLGSDDPRPRLPARRRSHPACRRNSASFGASTAAEADLAERIVACYPAIEKMRFVSSGTEATMSAIRVARAATGRKIIIKFEGCYHGHADGLLVKAGSGVATFGIPGSAGVPDEIAHLTLALPYNDIAAVEAAFDAHPDVIAAIIVEPIVGNAGCIPPAPGYLAGLRAITRREGALLIVDEVMTGFRVALGGACELYSLDPDLVTLGKIVGGGLPVGVFGGKRKFMDLLAPLGPVYQAGTLSGNPLAMAAGIATIAHLQAHAAEIYPQLEATSKAVFEGVAAQAASRRHPSHHQSRRRHGHLVLHPRPRHQLR